MKLIRNAPQVPDLEFIPAPRGINRKGWMMLAFAVLTALAAATHLYLQQAEINALRTELAELRSRQASIPAKPGLTLPDPTQAQLLTAQLDADWGGMLAALAKPLQPELSILEIQADTERGTLRIVGQAPSLALAFQYIEQLQDQAELQGIAIDSYAWPEGPNAGSLDFTASGRWRGKP